MDSTSTSVGGLIVGVIAIVGLWRVFTKAGLPGWGAIIPLYNIYLLMKVAGRPGWWVVLYLIPIVNIIVHLIVSMDVARNFGKSKVFGVVGLWLFNVIGFLILGFGDARYVGERGVAGTGNMAAAY
ncbi:DUF5684 domain-containing protein [Kutzneria sp. CA-103260]|uniref:DUF5684 domain-containing protein n=1 Tax=Kutzneria sp. CA-103260 TaxID=2802641 RepID=UPI001BABB439|nr:DUF5684 domain-containing protein [Kutzneria sp. CA-103260]QUQ69195.1 hypothetical protein JJ691_69490 [Kutzneria sp. CA-103260]